MFKTSEELKALSRFLWVVRKVRPVLEWFGVTMNNLGDLTQTCHEALEVSKFNDVFADRGWIAHRWLNMPAALEALKAAGEDRWNDADAALIESYDPDSVRLFLKHLTKLKCFERRRRLALLALDDYAASRFHACIPVVLALLDGMGQELTGAGFLRQGVRFAKTNSFLEIGPGATALIKRITESRGSVTTSEIDMPFRHGILHGTDLGYDTKLVAAKTWGALLALGSHAMDMAESSVPEEPRKGILETFKESAAMHAKSEDIRRFCESWKPRTSAEIVAAERRGFVASGTPVSAALELMTAWRKRNFGALSALSADSRRVSVKGLAGRIRENVGDPPTKFELEEVEETAPAAAWVTLTAEWPNDERIEIRLRLIHFADEGAIIERPDAGTWLIYSLWPLEAVALRVLAVQAGRK